MLFIRDTIDCICARPSSVRCSLLSIILYTVCQSLKFSRLTPNKGNLLKYSTIKPIRLIAFISTYKVSIGSNFNGTLGCFFVIFNLPDKNLAISSIIFNIEVEVGLSKAR